MSVLTRGRKEPCKNNVGGVHELYLTSFVPYSAKLIIGYRDMLLTSFPTTLIFQYYGQNKEFGEVLRDGAYSQEIKIRFTSQSFDSAALLEVLLKKKLRAIVVEWLEVKLILLLKNGLKVISSIRKKHLVMVMKYKESKLQIVSLTL